MLSNWTSLKICLAKSYTWNYVVNQKEYIQLLLVPLSDDKFLAFSELCGIVWYTEYIDW